MKIKAFTILIARLFFGILLSGPVHAETKPMEIISGLWTETKTLSQELDPSHREESVKNSLRAHYDFESFYQSALQDYWPQWTPEQKKAFSGRFETVFLNSLVHKLSRIPRGDVSLTLESQKRTSDRAELKFRGAKADKHVGFRVFFVRNADAWKINDVEVAGALLSRNYRGQFNHILRTQGFDALLAKLDQQIKPKGEQ